MTQPVATEVPVEPAPSGALALAAMEAAIAGLVLGMYTAWLGAVTAAVLAPFTRFGLSPDPAAVWSLVPLWERQLERLMTALERMARHGWIDAAAQLGVDFPFDPSDSILADQLMRTRNLMVRTPDEVYRQILGALGKSVAAGEAVPMQAERVRHILNVTGTENWPARAKTVAVTEVYRAYNFGALALSLKVQQSEMRTLLKRWDAREDNRTRPAHDRADGQTVAVSQPFIVDNEALMAPGDPSGSPHNVINCRCKPKFSRREA